MKRILFLVLVLVLATGLMAFAEEGLTIFTYEAALEAAVKNSIQPALDDYNIKAKESALEDARDEAIKGFIGGTPQEVVERKIIKEVAPFEAQTAVEVARRQKVDHEKQMRADVYQEMMRVLLAQENVTLKKEQLALVERKYAIDKIQFHEGLLAESTIVDEELALAVEKLELQKMETAMKSDILNMKQKMHIDLEDQNQIGFDFSLQKLGTHYVMDVFNVDRAIEKAVAENTDVYEKEKALEAAQKKLEITKQHLKPGHDFYDQKVYEQEAADKALYDAKTNLEVSIRNAHNDLFTALEALELANKKLDLEKSRLDTLMVKLNSGMISRRDMIDTEINVVARKQEVLQAVCDFNIKSDILKNLLGD